MPAEGLVTGLTPGAGLWSLKGLTDGLVRLAQAGPAGDARALLPFLALGLGTLVARQAVNTLSRVTSILLQERVRYFVSLTVLQHGTRLDLTYYEDPPFYDKLERARRGFPGLRGLRPGR